MEIAHLSDIHIRNYYYHDVYREIFDDLYQELRARGPDEIFVTGDLAHTKTSLSPEYFDLATDFLSSLADIATTRVFIGNHDCNIRNKHRTDAISPVVEAIDDSDLIFHKESATEALQDNLQLYHLSIFDQDWDTLPRARDKVELAVFHGSIKGAETDRGWVMRKGELTKTALEKYDFALLGDIHKSNQVLDEEGRCRYAGSLIQQNHGEELGKGFLYWDIQGEDQFDVDFVELDNPRPFYTIELDPDGEFDASNVPEGCRLRIKRAGTGYKKAQEAVEYAKKECDVHSVTCVRGSENGDGVAPIVDNEDDELNIDSVSVQEELLEDFFDDDVDEDKLSKIKELNKDYNGKIEHETTFDMDWSLKKLHWDYLFNFGKGNYIDFSSKDGIVGIFGENYSGKSSIIDSFLYTLFNKTGKDLRKNQYVVNKNQKKGWGKVVLERGGREYCVERETTKVPTQGTSHTSNDFYRRDKSDKKVSMNESGRRKTDKKIRSMFGSYENFKRTSFISQLNALEFVSETSTRRKKILSNFLNLEPFRQKYDLVTDDLRALKADLEQREGDNPAKRLGELREELSACERNKKGMEDTLQNLKDRHATKEEKLEEIQGEINSVPAEPIDIDEVEEQLGELQENLAEQRKRKKKLSQKIDELEEDFEETREILASLNSDDIEEDIEQYKQLDKEYNDLLSRLQKRQKKREEIEEYSEYLENPPCSPEYTDCQLVQEAHEKLDRLESVQADIESLEGKKESLVDQLSTYDIDSLRSDKEKYETLEQEADQLQNQKTSCELKLERCKSKIDDIEDDIKRWEEKRDKFEKNREAIENLEALTTKRDQIEQELDTLQTRIDQKEEKVRELYKQYGFIEQEIGNMQKKKEELADLRFEYEALDMFRDAMHSNGIPFEIIKERLSVINGEISEIISGFFDFEIFFQHRDNELDIFISHPDEEPRPIELGSGAEKTVASIVIRMALLNVSSIPKGDVFILDEPATELDSENLQSFMDILDLIKSQFRVVILVSHLESLKDCVDDVITIEQAPNNNDYAQVQAS